MKDYKYTYKNGKKYTCANCGQKTMKRFIDTTTGELIGDEFGVCERIFSCGYEKRPGSEVVEKTQMVERPATIPFYFQKKTMDATLHNIPNSTLYLFLAKKFGKLKVGNAFVKYRIGTTDFGDTIFWQMDETAKIRAGKRIQYFSDGHRNKARGASWLHWSNGFEEGRHALSQCLFGQHLTDDKYKNIFIVESEKTALICEICKKEPDALFLATGGLQNLGLISKLETNPNQKIWCLPDNDANDVWREKIERLKLNASVKIINALQVMSHGSDIGDLLLNAKNRTK